MLLACVNGQPVAGHVSSTLGDTCIYVLGASSELGRKYKASYLLQWRAIEAAKAGGARWYDLGGVDPEKNPGVYHFKAGVNGRSWRFTSQIYACSSRASKYLVAVAERAYRALRDARRIPGAGAAWAQPSTLGHPTAARLCKN